MRDFRVRQWAGGATAFLAVIGTGKMPVPRLVPWRACKVGAREFPMHARRSQRARSPQRLVMSMVIMGRRCFGLRLGLLLGGVGNSLLILHGPGGLSRAHVIHLLRLQRTSGMR